MFVFQPLLIAFYVSVAALEDTRPERLVNAVAAVLSAFAVGVVVVDRARYKDQLRREREGLDRQRLAIDAVLDEIDASPELRALRRPLMQRLNDASKEYEPTINAVGSLVPIATVVAGIVLWLITRLF